MQISIIIPTYNVECYIGTCLDSVLKTQLDEYEVIVIDDGSTDGTIDLLRSYQKRDARIKLITQSNHGAAAARNKGIEIATGEYIGFVDSDDWVESAMFSKMYQTAKSNDADIVFCNLFRNASEKQKEYMPKGLYDKEQIVETIFPRLISNTDENKGKTVLRGSVWSKIFRSTIIRQNNIRFDEQLVYNEDTLFVIQATLHANRYYYLGDEYLYHNRYVSESITKRYIGDLWERQKNIGEKLNGIVADVNYDFSKQINKKSFEVAIYCVENIYKPSCNLRLRERMKETERIVTDPITQNCIHNIYPEKLARLKKGYYYTFKYKLISVIPLLCIYRRKRNER